MDFFTMAGLFADSRPDSRRKRTRGFARLRILGAGSLAVSVLLAGLVLWRSEVLLRHAREAAREQNRLKLAAARERVENYFAQVRLTLMTFRFDPSVEAMSRESQSYLQRIFDENYNRHQLSEIYVIERDFAGTSRPFMTFEKGDESGAEEELHTPEREAEEYAVQRNQILRFAQTASLETLVSPPIDLCVGRRGIVVSVPIRTADGLRGIVAGMTPIEILEAQLSTSGLQSDLVLRDPEGSVVARSRGADRESGGGEAQRGLPNQLSDSVSIAGNDGWHLSLAFDERAESHTEGPVAIAGWIAAVGIAFLGLAVFHFCRLTPTLVQARIEAERGRQREAELAHVMRLVTVSELTTGLAHELNQPLAAIETYAEVCARRSEAGAGQSAEQTADLREIAAQAERAGKVIQYLRKFVRRHDGEHSLHDLNEIVRNTGVLLRNEISRNGVRMNWRLVEGAAPVEVEGVAIEQVLINLIRNAIDATAGNPAGEREIVIETAINRASRRAECAVHDNGVGLGDQQNQRDFVPFVSTKAGGLGMGLAISRAILESHDGELIGSRNIPRGATFRFSLPLARV